MKKERDWLDYVNTTSSVGQNIELSQISSQLEQIRSEQNIQAALREARLERDEEAVKIKANIRNLLFEAIQILESVKSLQNTETPVKLALRLNQVMGMENLKPDIFDSWEDKERFVKFASELRVVHAAVSEKLTPEERADVPKCKVAFEELKKLNRLILLDTHFKHHSFIKGKLNNELDELKHQRKALSLNILSFRSLEAFHELTTKIEQKRFQVLDHEKNGAFYFLPEVASYKSAQESVQKKMGKDLSEKLKEVAGSSDEDMLTKFCEKLSEELLDLKEHFDEINDPIQYRTELLQSVTRCLKLNSPAEAENFILRDEYDDSKLMKVGPLPTPETVETPFVKPFHLKDIPTSIIHGFESPEKLKRRISTNEKTAGFLFVLSVTMIPLTFSIFYGPNERIQQVCMLSLGALAIPLAIYFVKRRF